MIEESLRIKNGSVHLMEWFKIVQKSNTAKKVIPTYERWFRLQHYWRLLHRRYPQPLRRKKEALIQAFASYLGVSDATVKTDLRRISTLLGTGWEHRFAELP